MVTAEQIKVEINLELEQFRFFETEARHPAFIGGRGAGKTYVLVCKAFKLAIENPGIRGLITEPTFGMIRENLMPVIDDIYGKIRVRTKEEIKRIGPGPGDWDYRLFLQGTPQEIVFSNGSIIVLRPVDDPDKFRGASYGFFAMDEVAIGIQQYGAFMVLSATLRQDNMPQQGFIVSTPSARKPWIRKIWKEHVTAVGDEPLDSKTFPLFQMTMDENRHLSKEMKETNKMLYGGTKRGRQEQLGGMFVSTEGLAFENFSRETHVKSPPDGLVIKRRLAGLDFGAASPTSMHLGLLDTEDRLWIVREFYKRRADDYTWGSAAYEWIEEGLTRIVFDPSRSESEIEDLRAKYGLPLRRARSKRFEDRVRVMETRLAIRPDGKPGVYFSPQCPNAIEEIENLAYAEARAGEFIIDKWSAGLNDHAFDDITYLMMEVDRTHAPLQKVKVGFSLG